MSDLAAYLLKSGAFLALFYAFYRFGLRRETFFALNRAYLVGAAALSLVLPLLHVTSPFFKTIIHASPLPSFIDKTSPGPLPTGAKPVDLLLAAYVAGAALSLLMFVARVGRLALMARRCGCVRQRGLRVVLCGSPGGSFSFFHFVFVDRSKVPEGDMDRVLAHELAHVRQLHSLDVVFMEILSAIQWFNPFVWPYKRSLRETHEYLADRAVIAQGGGLARYQLLIVEQHVGGKLLELASGFRTSQIKRRIVMMSRQETKGLARWKPLLALPLAVALVLAFAESRPVVKEGPAVVGAQASAQAGQERVEKGGGQPGKMSEEEFAKAFKEKAAQLEEMKKKNQETMAKLQAKLAEAPDAATKEKIQAEMDAQKVLAYQIGAKERMLQMEKLEYALIKETDPAKKADLEKKFEQLQAEADEYAKKAGLVKKAKVDKEKQEKR